MVKAPVYEVYGGQIWEMRQCGFTLQAIGDEVGVTKERIRQILVMHHSTAAMPNLISRHRLVQIIGCTLGRLVELEKEGAVSPIHIQRYFLYSQSELDKVMLSIQRFCKHCGRSLPLKRQSKLCSECYKERKRNSYPFLSEDAKRKRRQSIQNWINEHPGRVNKYHEEKRIKLLTMIDKISKEKAIYGVIGILAYDAIEDKVQCHICGRWYRGLPTHVRRKHGWTCDEYREDFGLNRGQGLICEGSREKWRLAAKRLRTWERLPAQTMNRSQLSEYLKSISPHSRYKKRIQYSLCVVRTRSELKEKNLKAKKWLCSCGKVFPIANELRSHRKVLQCYKGRN